MHFARLALTCVALAVASAKVIFTNSDFSGIAAGTAFVITWSGNTGAVTLKLKDGPADAQILVGTIATGLTGSSFSWTPKSLPSGTYNLEIDDSNGDINYSVQFQIVGDITVTSTSAPATTVASTTSAVASVTTLSSLTSTTGTANSTKTTASTSTKTTTTAAATSTGAASRYGSPLALVFAGVVAIAGLN